MRSSQERDAAATGSEPALSQAFRSAFRGHPVGVAIVTADPGGGPIALTVSSLISVNATPPMVAFSLSDVSASARALALAETVVIHFVRRSNLELARLCATSGKDRFGADVLWDRLPGGEPYYPEVGLRFRALMRDRLRIAGASLVVAELVESSTYSLPHTADEPIVYLDRAWHSVGGLIAADRPPLILWPDDSPTF